MEQLVSGDIITLRGKTLKGKNRVREHGSLWRIVSVSTGTRWVKRGMLNIEPVEQRGRFPEGRWIMPVNDPDFEILDISA